MTNNKIKIVKKDLFKSNAQCIVNTTNSVGVMGKGVALKFSKKYPKECELFNLYSKKILARGSPTLLKPKFVPISALFNPKYIMFFPTKIHWKNNSKLEYIERNLPIAFDQLNKRNITSVSFPWPGCGNGNLDKDDVLAIFIKHIDKYSGKVLIHEFDYNNN